MNELLKGLGLTQLAQQLPTVLDAARQQQLSYEAFLRQALESEVQGRQRRALERRLRAAHLPARTRLESFDFTFQPTLSERLVRELAGFGLCGECHECGVPGSTRSREDPFGERIGGSSGRSGLHSVVHDLEPAGRNLGGDPTSELVAAEAAALSATEGAGDR